MTIFQGLFKVCVTMMLKNYSILIEFEAPTSGIDLPSLYRLNYETIQGKVRIE